MVMPKWPLKQVSEKMNERRSFCLTIASNQLNLLPLPSFLICTGNRWTHSDSDLPKLYF